MRNIKKCKFLWIVLAGAISLSGCYSHPIDVGRDGSATNLTVGKVQGEIKIGMPASGVAAILGSPNNVTTDENRHEVWIYDKVSSNRVDTRNYFGGGIPFILGGRTDQAEKTSTQKALTIIIKFDELKKVRDVAYNYTQF